MGPGGYQELDIWQRSRHLAVEVYARLHKLPAREQYALMDQLRRCAVSVPSNIAEGWGRASTQEFIRFLRIARGSLMELETQVILAHDFGYIDDQSQAHLLGLTDEVSRKLMATIKGLQKTAPVVVSTHNP